MRETTLSNDETGSWSSSGIFGLKWEQAADWQVLLDQLINMHEGNNAIYRFGQHFVVVFFFLFLFSFSFVLVFCFCFACLFPCLFACFLFVVICF